MNPVEFIFRLLFSICFVIPILGVYVVLLMVKTFVCVIVTWKWPNLQLMSIRDCMFVLDNRTLNPQHMLYSCGLAVLEGKFTVQEMKEFIWKAFIKSDNSNFRKVPSRMFCYWFWKDVKSEFDISNHVQLLDGLQTEDDVITDEQLYEMLRNIKPQLDGKPLWKISIVPNYMLSEDPCGKTYSALVLHLHHVYGDGTFIFQTLNSVNVPTYNKSILKKQKLLLEAVVFLKGIWSFSYGVQTLLSIAFKKWTNPLHGKELKRKNHTCCSKQIKFEILREIRRNLNVSTTAVMLGALSETLNEYFASSVDNKYRAIGYISTKIPERLSYYGTSSNSSTLQLIPLPVNIMNMHDRVTTIENWLKQPMTKHIRYLEPLVKLVCSVLPHFSKAVIIRSTPVTVGTTSMVASSAVTHAIGNCVLYELQTQQPPDLDVGIIATYSGCRDNFRLTTVINDAYAESREEAKLFVESWYRNVMKLYETVMKLNNNMYITY